MIFLPTPSNFREMLPLSVDAAGLVLDRTGTSLGKISDFAMVFFPGFAGHPGLVPRWRKTGFLFMWLTGVVGLSGVVPGATGSLGDRFLFDGSRPGLGCVGFFQYHPSQPSTVILLDLGRQRPGSRPDASAITMGRANACASGICQIILEEFSPVPQIVVIVRYSPESRYRLS